MLMLQDQALTWKVPSNQTEWQPQSWAIVWVFGMPRSVRVLQRGLQEIPSIKLHSAEQCCWTLTVATCSWGDSLNSFLHIGSIYYIFFWCSDPTCHDLCMPTLGLPRLLPAIYCWGACVPVAVIIPFPQMQGSSIRRFLRMSRKWRKTRSWQRVQLFFSLAACSPQIFSVWLVCSGFFHGVEVCINLGTIGLVTTLKLRCKVFRRGKVGSFHPQLVKQFGKS